MRVLVMQHQRQFREQSQFWTSGKSRAFKRWVLTFIIGILTALIGVGVTWATRTLMRWKMETVLGKWLPLCRVRGAFTGNEQLLRGSGP